MQCVVHCVLSVRMLYCGITYFLYHIVSAFMLMRTVPPNLVERNSDVPPELKCINPAPAPAPAPAPPHSHLPSIPSGSSQGAEREVYHPATKFTQAEKVAMAHEFVKCGSLVEVSRQFRIKFRDIVVMADQAWWVEEIANAERETTAHMKVRLSRIFTRTIDEIEDRLDNGDTIYDTRVGRVVRVEMKAKDLVAVAAAVFDKERQLIIEDTKDISEEAKRLLELAAALRVRAGGGLTIEYKPSVPTPSARPVLDFDSDE